MSLSPPERALCEEIGIPEAAALQLKEVTGNDVERAARNSWDERQPPFLPALSSVGSPEMLNELQARLPSGLRAYYSQRSHCNMARRGLELLVTGDLDPLFIVRGRLTSGANYDVSHEDVLAKLEDWSVRFGIDVMGANHDFVELRFERLPADLMGLVEEIYWFCTDVTEPEGDEGDEEREPVLFARAEDFPEPSPEFFERNNQEDAKVMGDGWELVSAPGLRLLAAGLERDHTVYLWWD